MCSANFSQEISPSSSESVYYFSETPYIILILISQGEPFIELPVMHSSHSL